MGEQPQHPPGQARLEHRRLVAVMFTDVKGFTSLMEEDETTAIGLVKAQREIIRRNIALHQGEERETIGDAFLVIFASAVNAVRSALDIQREIWEFNQSRDPDQQVWVRIGIHLGDIIIEEGSIFGEGVNLAARVEPLAEPGGICITRQVYDQVRHHLQISVSELGVRELKNISDVPDLYRIEVETAAPRQPPSTLERLQEWLYTPLRKGIAAALLLIALAANAYWSFFVPHRTYTREVAFIRHLPVEVSPISSSEAWRLHRSFILTRRGHRVVRLEEVTRPWLLPQEAQEQWESGFAVRPRRDFPIHEYRFEGGRFKEERVLDRFGVLQHRLLYGEGGKIATVHDGSGFVKSFENQISGFGYEFDDAGHVVRRENRNAFGIPRADATGAASYRFAYGEQGLPTEITAFDASGNITENKDGVATTRKEYDDEGRLSRETFLDRYGVVRESLRGVASVEREQDSLGRTILERFLNRTGQPSPDVDGVCARRSAYDEAGRLVEATSLSCSGSPRATRQGFATLRYRYDGDRIVREEHLGEDGRPAGDAHGIGAITIAYDDGGRIGEQAFFDEGGSPVVGADGAHRVHYGYDDRGRPALRAFDGIDGAPAIGAAGYAEVRVKYNERGDASEWAYFDTSGALVNRHEGYALVRNERDSFGNLTSISFFGKEMEPVMGRGDACHRISIAYSEYGDVRETRCFDGKDKLTPGIRSCAISRFEHDPLGRLTRMECFVDEGKLIDTSGLPSVLTYAYDERGYLREVRAFDAAGEPAERYQGAAVWRRLSDEHGNAREIATYDRAGHLINNAKYKAAIFRREFDSRGNELRLQAFDQNEKPTTGIWGFAEIRFSYDDAGHRTSESYFDGAGEPVKSWQGVHLLRTTYDASGRVAEMGNFDADGQPSPDVSGIALTRYRYDRWGQLERTSYFDAEGLPVLHRRLGSAEQGLTMDARGNVTTIERFGANGQLCAAKPCIAVTEQEFDARGLMTRQIFRAADGAPASDEEGAGGYSFEYDEQRRIQEKHVLGPDGKDGKDASGIHQYHLVYRPERADDVWFMTFRDEKGDPALSRRGAGVRIVLYDPLYQKRPRARIDLTPEGSTRAIQCLDEAGNLTASSACATPEEGREEFLKIKPLLATSVARDS